MASLLEQRRGSAASSVSVTIETVTTTTPRPDDLAPTDEAPVTFVSPWPSSSRRGSAAGVVPHPSHNPAPAAATSAHAPSSAFPPPPPYADPAPTPRATVHPLSFFAFASLSPVPSPSLAHRSSAPDAHVIDMPAPPPPPPAYAATPRTEAERRFWRGFLCPVLWALGARRIWRSERPLATLGALGGAAAKDGEAGEGEGAQGWSALPPDVREPVELWREEELVWARRCLWALFAMVGAAGILGLALLSVLNVMG